MSDIVETLHAACYCRDVEQGGGSCTPCNAADEIESLREENRQLAGAAYAANELELARDAAWAECDALRDKLNRADCICLDESTRADCPAHALYCSHGHLLGQHECTDSERGIGMRYDAYLLRQNMALRKDAECYHHLCGLIRANKTALAGEVLDWFKGDAAMGGKP